MRRKLYQAIASTISALENSELESVKEVHKKHLADLLTHMPSGSGFDSGTTILLTESEEDKLVFHTSYHHMNENGYYIYWTEHRVVVRPSLVHGFVLRLTGPNENDIKEYIGEVFDHALRQEVE